jgi:hypothetical protein
LASFDDTIPLRSSCFKNLVVEYVVSNAEEIIHALPTQYLSEAMVDTNDDKDVATTAALDEDDINAALTVSPPTYAIM